jgi:PIN domain nuclease of toxin-antitoxin system
VKLLLDTQILIWAAARSELLPEKARHMLMDVENEFYFSAASIWEVTIKNSQNRPDFRVDPGLLRRCLLDRGHQELSITGPHAVAVRDLPLLHKDPFDRILIAQAKTEGILLLTSDAKIAEYPAPIEFVPKAT